MAALVGTIGTAVQSTVGGSASPTFGASENRTAGNLLILYVTVTSTATLPVTPAGWYIAKQVAGTSTSSTIYYRNAAGSDAAPVIAGITNGVIAAQLAEFSATKSTIDQTGSATGITSPNTATAGGANAATGELIVMAGADKRSVNRASNDTWTSNDGTVTQAGNNNGVSSQEHYSFGYIASSTATTAETSVLTLSITTSITGLANVNASFLKGVGTFLVYSQAQMQVKAIGVNGFAQAQLKIIPSRVFAQAQAKIVNDSTYENSVISDSPIAYWRLGEASGNPQDSIGTNHVDTIGGTPTYSVAHNIGDSDTAITFNGTDQYFTAPDVNGFSIGTTGKLTVEAWIYPTATTGADRAIVSKSGGSGYEWVVTWNSTDTGLHSYVFTLAGAGIANTGDFGGTMPPNAWYHVAFVFDETGDRQLIYLNGVTNGADTDVWTAATQNGTGPLQIGRRGDGIQFFQGTIDEVAIYNYEVSAARILAHFNAGQVVVTTNNGFAQAQLDVKQTYRGYAQAQMRVYGPYYIKDAFGAAGGPQTTTNAAPAVPASIGDIYYVSILLDGALLTSISDDLGNTYVQRYATALPNGKVLYTYYSVISVSGTPTITVNFTSSNYLVDVVQYRREPLGPDWLLPYASASATGTSATAATAALSHGFLNVGIVISNVGSTVANDPPTVSSSFQRRIHDAYTAHSTAIEDALLYSSNVIPTFTLNQSDPWAINAISFQPAGLGFSQAQLKVLGGTNAFAQAQLDTKAISRGYAQAQLDTKAISQSYAQAQFDTKQISRGYAQAQVDIKQTSNGFAQAQLDIKAITKTFAQAQLKIIPSRIFAQALLDVDTGIYTLTDTFTRTIGANSGWGTADSGTDWTTLFNDGYSVNGSQGVFDTSAEPSAMEQKRVTTKNVSINYQFKNIINTDSHVYWQGTGHYLIIYASGTNLSANLSDNNNIIDTNTSYITDFDNTQFYQVELESFFTGPTSKTVRYRIYRVGTSIPDWYTISNFATATLPGGGFGYIATLGDGSLHYVDNINVNKFVPYGVGQAQLKISTTKKFAQAQLDIKATTTVYSQAQADIKAIRNQFAQAQLDVKSTYTVYAQAQVDILATSRGYAQAQLDVKAVINAFAQAQLKISTTDAFAQAQLDTKQIYRGYAQSQADIKATSNVFAQSQLDIKAIYTTYAQAQLDSKQIYRGYAQAQVDILTSYQGYAQAQLDTKQTYRGYAQAQLDIKTTYQKYAQAQLDVLETYNGFAQAQLRLLTTYNGFSQAQLNILTTYRGYAQAQAKINAFGVSGFAQAQLNTKGIDLEGVGQAQMKINAFGVNGYGQAQLDVQAIYRGYGQAQLSAKNTYKGYGQSQLDILVIYRGFAQAQLDLKQIYQGYAQAQVDIKQIYQGYAQAQLDVVTSYQGYGQAQADIRTVYKGYGQAQFDIRTTYQKYAQAQLDVLSTYQGYAQAHLDVLATYQRYGQAQLDVLTSYQGFGQTNLLVVATYQGYANAQLDVLATYQGYAQAQVDIKATYNSFAQAQLDVVTTYQGYAQANLYVILIQQGYGQAQLYNLVGGFGFSQAQIFIITPGISEGQAQLDVRVTTNQFAQAQLKTKQTSNGYAQAQGLIRQTEDSFAQTQLGVKAIYQGYGQAQLDTLTTNAGYAQAQLTILTTYVKCGQAQLLVARTEQGYSQAQINIIHAYQGYAQAQCSVKSSTRGYAQAQIITLTNYVVCAQSQFRIKVTNLVYAQAQLQISSRNTSYAQAQLTIKQAQSSIGQAQLALLQTYTRTGNAQATISTTLIVSGQAQLVIAAKVEFAQAQLLIKVAHILKRMVLSDRNSLAVIIKDKLIQSSLGDQSLDMVEKDTQIKIQMNNRKAAKMKINDKAY